MKKIIVIPALVVTFILGVALSDLVMQGINGILGTGIITKASLQKKLEEARKKQEETDNKVEAAVKKYDELSQQVDKKKANLDKLMNELNTGVNASLVKDILLTTPSDQTGDKGRIFLDASGAEALLKPTTDDDPTVQEFKNTFNKKAKEILDVSKGIMKDKIGQLNRELLRINDEVKDRNIELIGKLREEEKYKKKIDDLNSELVDTNDQLKERNQELNAKLKEVEKYKQELEEHKKYINDLEDIKSDLQKTVGVLETKIEDGRLKVSFEGDILFESGKHELKEEGRQLLERAFSVFSKSVPQNDVFIAGHTDNVPIREDARDRYESNWVLSTYRAVEVVKYLVGKGLSPQSVTAAGYGEYKPVADNSTVEGRAENRRVELFLIPRIIKR